ncbi:MAG: type II toxin-antitoxin system VapC family toxin [Acidobacteriota bacterium]
MAVILDTGIIYAYYDRRDSWHKRSMTVIGENAGALITPVSVIPEVDHLLGHRLGWAAQRAFYRGLADGFYFVAELSEAGYTRVADLNEQFSQLQLGFVDAAVMATAEMLGLGRIATTDRRDFGTVRIELPLVLLP